jgi:hypothetical protein
MRLKTCFFLASMAFACGPYFSFGQASVSSDIQIALNKTEIQEGQNVVVDAVVQDAKGQPASGLMIHAQVDGKDWGAEYRTLPSGVSHLVLPIPERGTHSIVITDGTNQSKPATVKVDPRHFNIIDDPSHQVIMEYETWFGPGYAEWGKEEATPLLGRYSSLDPRVLRQQALWFDETGINVVELDWTNNLTKPFPSKEAKECIAAMDALLKVYSTMPQHPKILMLMGPENNLWRDSKDVYAGPWFKQQMDYLYDHYIHNPKYRDMFVTYEGKPLMLYYLNGPRFVAPPDLTDPRFTARYVGAWLQFTHEEKYGVWSWYDQSPVPTMYQGKAEALTVTDGYPSVHETATGLNNWAAQDAGGKNNGETLRTQWEAAMKYKPRFLFLNQWNEFVPPDQYNANMSNDLEPTLMTEKEDSRASGWGFAYMELTRDEIARYHAVLGTPASRGKTESVSAGQ